MHSGDAILMEQKEVDMPKEEPTLVVLMPAEAIEVDELDSAEILESEPMEMGETEELEVEGTEDSKNVSFFVHEKFLQFLKFSGTS